MNNNDRKLIQDLDDKVDKIMKYISRNVTSIEIIKTNHETLKEDITQLKDRILGNNRPGLCDVVNTHKTYFRILGVTTTMVTTTLIGIILNKII